MKSFQAIINLVFEIYNTIESPLRILYFTPNFTDMLFNAFYRFLGNFLDLTKRKGETTQQGASRSFCDTTGYSVPKEKRYFSTKNRQRVKY